MNACRASHCVYSGSPFHTFPYEELRRSRWAATVDSHDCQGTLEIAIIRKDCLNRHGLIAGAGTGKTITLRTMAERFSAIGVPVFMADVKGDLSGGPALSR